MLGFRVELADFTMAAIGQGGDVVFCTVDDASLQCRIDFTPGHRRWRRAERLDHLDRRWTLLHADLQALEVVRRVDRFLAVETAGAGVVVSQADETALSGGSEDRLTHRAFEHLEEVGAVTEDERQVKYLVLR